MNTYYPGASVRFSVTATLLGVLVNPTSLVLTLRGPDETIVANSVLNDSTGQYHADVVLPLTAKPGRWVGTWIATGAAASSGVAPDIIAVQALP